MRQLAFALSLGFAGIILATRLAFSNPNWGGPDG